MPRAGNRAGRHPETSSGRRRPLNRRRHPDIVVAGLHDDERGGERTQVNPGELGGDRSLPAGSGPHVTRPGVAVDHRFPVQQTGQQDGPRTDRDDLVPERDVAAARWPAGLLILAATL